MAQKNTATDIAWPNGVAKPAQRALASAGYTRLDQLVNAREADLAALHGMGQKAIGIFAQGSEGAGKIFSEIDPHAT